MKTGNGSIQTGYRIISPTFWTPIKKISFTNYFELLIMSLILASPKKVLKTGNGSIQTGNVIISPTFWAPSKTSFTTCF